MELNQKGWGKFAPILFDLTLSMTTAVVRAATVVAAAVSTIVVLVVVVIASDLGIEA